MMKDLSSRSADLDHNRDPITAGPTHEHAAGRIAVPGRVRSEARILALVGASYAIGGLGLCGVGCTVFHSISVN
jgi:hypothetical protein